MRPLLVALLALVLAGAAAASELKPTSAELESELVCPVCETTLDQSDAPVAQRMKSFIRQRIAAGDTEHHAQRDGNGPVDASLKAIESKVRSGAEMLL